MSKNWKFRYQMYKHLQAHTQDIYAEARQAAEEIGMTSEMRGNIGLTGAISASHGYLKREVSDAMDNVARKVVSSASLDEGIRDVVKEVYGDGYDAALVNTCEAGLMVSFDVLCMPPTLGRGVPYRGRYIAFYERFMHHPGSYGRPFPPKYKEYLSEQGETAGEYGIQGKRAANLDAVIVRMEGARYDCHGIKYNPTPDLLHVDGEKTVARVAEIAARHMDSLVGFASLGYDAPGYGYGDKTEDGIPLIQTGLSALAARYDVPYIVDNAWGAPLIGADIRKLGADVMVYSMDKVTGSPTCGLMIGREEPMVQIRRALGIHGTRYGSLSSHGKAAYVTVDPGKEALVGALTALRILKDRPEIALTAFDQLFDIVLQEFESLPEPLKRGWSFFKSPNSLAVEMTYNDSWTDGEFGIPIFSVEDMYSGSNLIQNCISEMGILPTITFDGGIWVSNGLGNVDEDGRLLETPTRLALRGLFRSIEIVSRYAGLL
ncbi:MAG: hypothetical protein MUO76_06440 [Anaerolineaceae bacterium]|nr:hypothetical protein [Anaerolineaceae bacterium]